jgi:hypothetical protein
MEVLSDTQMTDTEIKLRIGYALSDRLAAMACAIQQNVTNSVKLIDQLPASAIEALLTYSREQHRNDHPSDELGRAHKDVRAALLRYGEIALREAQQRERRLLYGITGVPQNNGEAGE